WSFQVCDVAKHVMVSVRALDAARASVAPSPDLPESANGLLMVKPARAYVETLAHPIFSRTRAPFVPPPPPPPAAQRQVGPPVSVDPGIALGGVAIHGDLKKAYLLSKGGLSGSWVTEGETFMGWKVGSIEPGRVAPRCNKLVGRSSCNSTSGVES